MCSNSCISWQISFIFCMEVYLGKIYMPIVFGDAAPSVAPSVPSFIGSKVIYLTCVHSAGHISWHISFECCIEVHYTLIYTHTCMILVVLLLVLTIVRGTGGDLYVIRLFGGGSLSIGGRFFVHRSNKRMTQKLLPVPGDTFALRGNGDFYM